MFFAKNDKEAKKQWVINHPLYPQMRKLMGDFDVDATYGGPGGFGDRLVPDTMYGVDMSGIFYCHDGRFSIGGGQLAFDVANTMMLRECKQWLNRRDWWPRGTNWLFRRLAKKRAETYYMLVCFGGGLSFNWEFNQTEQER